MRRFHRERIKISFHGDDGQQGVLKVFGLQEHLQDGVLLFEVAVLNINELSQAHDRVTAFDR